jgi:hypothetical protein
MLAAFSMIEYGSCSKTLKMTRCPQSVKVLSAVAFRFT